MLRDHIILAIGWIAFGVLHSILATSRCKLLIKNLLGSQCRFYRLYYTSFALVTFVIAMYMLIRVPSPHLFEPGLLSMAVGVLITITGVSIMIICIAKYFMQLSGLRDLIEERTRNELMITGIHRS